MTNTKLWLMAIRPKTLTASLGPVILGLSYARFQYQMWLPYIFLLTLLCSLFLQIGTNLVNDYFDFKKGTDNETRLGPTRVTQSGLLREGQVKTAYQLVFLIAFILGIFLMIKGGVLIVTIGLLSLLTAYAYTGGPFPLSYFGMGELLAMFFFGPVAVWGTFYLQTGVMDFNPIILGLGPGLISAQLMSINNLRDHQSDTLANKKTLAVIFGETTARKLPVIFGGLSFLIPLLFFLKTGKLSLLLPILCLGFFIPLAKRILKGPIDSGLNETLAGTGKFLFIYCILFSLGFYL